MLTPKLNYTTRRTHNKKRFFLFLLFLATVTLHHSYITPDVEAYSSPRMLFCCRSKKIETTYIFLLIFILTSISSSLKYVKLRSFLNSLGVLR